MQYLLKSNWTKTTIKSNKHKVSQRESLCVISTEQQKQISTVTQ